MKTTGLDHYNLRAPRDLLERLRAFYGDVVGLTVGPRPPFQSFGYWLYAGAQPVLHLSEARDDVPTPTPSSSFDHAAFSCVGLPAFEARLSARGVAYHRAEVPLTGQVQLFFRDVAGNGVELNFSADEVP